MRMSKQFVFPQSEVTVFKSSRFNGIKIKSNKKKGLKAINKSEETHCGGNEIPSEITNWRKHGLMVGAYQEFPAHSQKESLFPVTDLFSHTMCVSCSQSGRVL